MKLMKTSLLLLGITSLSNASSAVDAPSAKNTTSKSPPPGGTLFICPIPQHEISWRRGRHQTQDQVGHRHHRRNVWIGTASPRPHLVAFNRC